MTAIIEKFLGTWLMNQLKQQGFSISILIIGFIIVFAEMKEVKRDSRNCQDKVVEILETVVKENTVVMGKINDKLTCK